MSTTSWAANNRPTRSARRRSAASSFSTMRSETSAPGRASARVRRSSRCGRSISSTMSWIPRNNRPTITAARRAARKSMSRLDDRRGRARAGRRRCRRSAPRDLGRRARRGYPAGNAVETAMRSRVPARRRARASAKRAGVVGPITSSIDRAVEHRARQRAEARSSGCRRGRAAPARNPPALGLEADQAGPGGGDPDGAAAVVACATGTNPPATAAAEPPDEPPGVRSGSHGLRVAKHVSLRPRPLPELGQGRLPDDDRARLPQPPHELAVLGLFSSGERAVAAEPRGEPPGEVDVVLDRDRDAEQRPVLSGLGRRASACSASASARSG